MWGLVPGSEDQPEGESGHLLGDGLVETVLGSEVVVDKGLVHPGPLGDLPHGGTGLPFLAEDLEGRLSYPFLSTGIMVPHVLSSNFNS